MLSDQSYLVRKTLLRCFDVNDKNQVLVYKLGLHCFKYCLKTKFPIVNDPVMWFNSISGTNCE